MPLREYKVLQRKAVMKKKYRIGQLVEFYMERSRKALQKGETYMPQLSVESLEVMVRYKYPKLGKITRRQYAEELYSVLKVGPNKRFWRETLRTSRGHW